MLRSKATVFGTLAVLVLMTGIFTATSADGTGGATAANIDEFVLINGDEVQETDYITRLAAVEQNLVMLRAQAESAPDDGGQAEAVLEILESTSPETIALASLILDMAIYQEAVERGYLPDQEMIAQQVEQERSMFETIEEDPAQYGVDEADVVSYRENIESIGEERYWSEFFPQMMEQQMAVQLLQMAASQEGEDWIHIQQRAFQNADVQIGDPETIAPATVADARAYLSQVWDIYESNTGPE